MQQEQESSQLCLAGCGFFGSQVTGGMCSVCYKKQLSNRQVESESPVPKMEVPAPSLPVEKNNTVDEAIMEEASSAATVATPEVATAAAASAAEDDTPTQKNKKRCWECKKKVGLTAIECRCGFVFCNSHRYADQHNCTFDFKASDRAELARRNPGGGQFGKLEKL